jgi:Uma2 family endonuclease
MNKVFQGYEGHIINNREPKKECSVQLLKTLPLRTDYTVLDYYALPEGSPYQLIEGELIMTPAPTRHHQSISRNLEFLILNHVKKNNLGFVYYAPIDVYLDDNNAFQPDIIFISSNNKFIMEDKGILGAPDLVIEIASPSTMGYDISAKQRVYERCGVKEYIMVNPMEKSVSVFLPENEAIHNNAGNEPENKPNFICHKIDLKENKTLYIKTLDLKIDLEEVFKPDV